MRELQTGSPRRLNAVREATDMLKLWIRNEHTNVHTNLIQES
jgi:hypothetical protein